MKYALLIAWREYAENAKTKGFWIGLFMFPTIVLISIQVPAWLETKGTPTRHYLLVDQSGQFEKVIADGIERNYQRRVLEELQTYARKNKAPKTTNAPASSNVGGSVLSGKNFGQVMTELSDANQDVMERFVRPGGQDFFLKQLKPFLKEDASDFEEPKRRYQKVELPESVKVDSDWTALVQSVKPFLRGANRLRFNGQPVDLFAAVLIPRDIDKRVVRPGATEPQGGTPSQGIEYWSGNLADTGLREEMERSVNGEIRRREYVSRGINLATVQQVERTHVPFANLNPKKEEGQEQVDRSDVMRQWAPAGFVYLLWIAIFSIIQMLLNNTIEEKSNRIIEVLLSSVTPGELMMGKLAGIAAVGMTMVTTWIGSLVVVLAWKSGAQSEIASELFKVLRTTHLVPAFAVYFLFGYLLYGGLILTIGSICNTLKEAQNYMGPIVLILTVPLMTMMFIPKDPNGTLATVLSWIPLYTPFVMMNRGAADPPLFDVIGTIILLAISTLVVLWLSGKIFRIGILRTGQPPKLIELIRWLRG